MMGPDHYPGGLMNRIAAALALTLGLLPAACMHPQPAARLDGTSWQLVELRSPDASVGIVRPDDAAKYQLDFGADGTLTMKLDCNRGTGRWSARPQAIGYGALTVTAGAMTRAMCEAGSLDTRIAKEIGDAHTYSIEGNRLTLILAGNGGSEIWLLKVE